MSNYRRAWVPGGACFFTVNLLRRDSRLLVERIDALRAAFRRTQAQRAFEIAAIVVLPDHLHCLWRLPEGDADNATRWRNIKAEFSRAVPPAEHRSARRLAKNERGIWQRRYWEHLIRDERDWSAHVDYIHINPVKHGHAERVADWPYSSFHRYVLRGDLPADWAGAAASEGGFGERGAIDAGTRRPR
ncbi:MAG: transposase [Rudaea sp.]|uniref:REP-associated tyrosine transposase n=1 Tax=Rudaea sp. TaxID=2136325 RepID=UPI0039E7290D